ncbi:MAG: hypothetical protein ABIM43_05025 [candidate division WOR-3 bacterium]
MSNLEFKGKYSIIQKEITKTATELFEISMLDTKTLKTFLYNLLLFDEIRQKIREIVAPLNPALDENTRIFPLPGKIGQFLVKEITRYFVDKGIFLEEELFSSRLYEFLNKQSEKSIEKRYQKIMRVVTHLFNTPLTSIALTLNIDRRIFYKTLGDRVDGLGEPLVKPNSWRDRILRFLNYCISSYKLGPQQKCLLSFFKGYIKLTNIIEILNKDIISSEERQFLVKNVGEPMIEITGGLVNYRDMRYSTSKTLNLNEILTELRKLIFNLLSKFGKEPSYAKETIFIYNMINSMSSFLVVGADIENLRFIDEDTARKAEKLRLKLAKLLIEKYKIESEEQNSQIYEGETIWRDILINRELSKEQASALTLLGLPVKNLSDPINYEKFMS